MMICYPDAGGAYTYVKEVFSPDYGFVAAWFLILAYMAVFWANVTSARLTAQRRVSGRRRRIRGDLRGRRF